MTVLKISNYLGAFAILAVVFTPFLPASAQDDTRAERLAEFDAFPNSPVDRQFLTGAEIHKLLQEYPVICEGNDDYESCSEFVFDSPSSGWLRSQYYQNDSVLINAYGEGAFEVSDEGVCIRPDDAVPEVEIVEEDNRLSRTNAAIYRYLLQLIADFVSLDCVQWAYSKDADALHAGPVLDQYESFRLTTGEWKFIHEPAKMVVSDTWTMRPPR